MKILENLGKTWSRNLFEMNFKKISEKILTDYCIIFKNKATLQIISCKSCDTRININSVKNISYSQVTRRRVKMLF